MKEDFDNLRYLRIEHLNAYMEYVKAHRVVEKIAKTQQQFFSTEAYCTANTIPFPVLLDKLSKFPKLYKGKKYTF